MGSEPVIKLSSPGTKEFWKISVLYEDENLLALDKPSRLLVSPDRYNPERPNLMRLLHRDIKRGADWASERGIQYLANAHRLDFETTGVLLLAKDKPTLVHLANQFGELKPHKTYLALVQGTPPEDQFEIDAKLASHSAQLGLMRVDPKRGKKSITRVEVLERFAGYASLQCRPLTGRTHQIRAHLRHVGLSIVGDQRYGGSQLLLSSLKRNYRLKPNATERPLVDRVALHALSLSLAHPQREEPVFISAPVPKEIKVALKYLRQFAGLR